MSAEATAANANCKQTHVTKVLSTGSNRKSDELHTFHVRRILAAMSAYFMWCELARIELCASAVTISGKLQRVLYYWHLIVAIVHRNHEYRTHLANFRTTGSSTRQFERFCSLPIRARRTTMSIRRSNLRSIRQTAKFKFSAAVCSTVLLLLFCECLLEPCQSCRNVCVRVFFFVFQDYVSLKVCNTENLSNPIKVRIRSFTAW